MNKGVISIIVPIFKVENYLDRCIESIVSQTYERLEIILVDDGSPDSCPQICEQWQEKDDRIKVIHKCNGGLSSARNAGLDVATGEYVAFIDSDDYVDKDMYKIMIEQMQKYNANIVSCGRTIINGDKIYELYSDTKVQCFSSEEALKELYSHGKIDEAAWDKLYKRDLFSDIRFPLGEINEDIVIMPFLMDKCTTIVSVGVPLYFYCLNGASITRSNYSNKKSILIKHIYEIEQYVRERHPDLVKYARMLEAEYAVGALMLLLKKEDSVREYLLDYHIYLSILKMNYIYYLRNKNIKITEKIKAGMIIIGMYSFVRKIKNCRNNWGKG